MRKTNNRNVDLALAFVRYFIISLGITSAALALALVIVNSLQ